MKSPAFEGDNVQLVSLELGRFKNNDRVGGTTEVTQEATEGCPVLGQSGAPLRLLSLDKKRCWHLV